ncbi:uncharacterized protein LOC128554649 [Mercenaria mercenaria]|uniref:uncharacterized protein LOC128554649 n=1 Tax=Mercenaria mercenaria TaxID=6596 RepID=UPI00234E4747|nr:uncharacterized protein LOC128554649 [Mercenaria mercenaria]
MRKKQEHPQHLKKPKGRLYSREALSKAYHQCNVNKMPVKRAAAIYKVPVTTLRDRVLGKVDHETAVHGKTPIFSKEEELKLKNHFKLMASLGYGYTRSECVDIAADFAFQLGKRTKDRPLTIKWIRGFLRRWPELRVLKPRGLEYARARKASEAVVQQYFANLKNTLEEHDFLHNPHLIYNIDEKGLTIDHKSPHIVASGDYCPVAVTSGKGKTVTLIGGASACREGQKLLVLLDGHRSHVSVGLCEWARDHGIVLFILPAHTSHILQPLDVSCYGPFQRMYDAACHKLMRQTTSVISRYNVCEIACKVYSKALSTDNVQSGFKKTGICPFNSDAVPHEYLIPAEVYQESSNALDHCSQDTVPGGIIDQGSQDTLPGGIIIDHVSPQQEDLFRQKEKKLREVKSKEKKTRNTISKVVSGREITDSILNKLKDHESEQNVRPKKTKQETLKSNSMNPKKQEKRSYNTPEPQPGPSHINIQDSDEETSSDSDKEEDKCCVCKKFSPSEVSRSISLIFVKWAQCDGLRNGQPCKHWVHLTYCTPVRVVRRGDHFYCTHCKKEE